MVVTRDAAYFTNSLTPVIYRVPVSRQGEVGEPETIPLSGPAASSIAGFNLNGIEATLDGRTLIVVNSAKGLLYTVDARTGASAEIDLGGATVPTGDGILLVGPVLFVLQNGAAGRREPDRRRAAELAAHQGNDRRHDHQPAVRDGDDAGAKRSLTRGGQRPVRPAAARRSRARGRRAEPASLRSVLAVDHVIVVVEDLETAARRYDDELGLASVPGGRHVGHGTGNRIVPLGSSYIELMAVVDRDEAASSPVGSWVERRLAEVGEGPGALCLRTDDIEAAARRTGHQPLAMGRTRPDGVQLGWHLVAHDAAFGDGLPFFIQWHVDDADHPGRRRRRAPRRCRGHRVGRDRR